MPPVQPEQWTYRYYVHCSRPALSMLNGLSALCPLLVAKAEHAQRTLGIMPTARGHGCACSRCPMLPPKAEPAPDLSRGRHAHPSEPPPRGTCPLFSSSSGHGTAMSTVRSKGGACSTASRGYVHCSKQRRSMLNSLQRLCPLFEAKAEHAQQLSYLGMASSSRAGLKLAPAPGYEGTSMRA
jgi:hypothetical protein